MILLPVRAAPLRFATVLPLVEAAVVQRAL